MHYRLGKQLPQRIDRSVGICKGLKICYVFSVFYFLFDSAFSGFYLLRNAHLRLFRKVSAASRRAEDAPSRIQGSVTVWAGEASV